MNSTKLLPIIQDAFITDSEALENTTNIYKAGTITFTSGIPSFTQLNLSVAIDKQINVGTTSKPIQKTVTEYTINGYLNTYKNKKLICPYCTLRSELLCNGTITNELNHIPFGSSHTLIKTTRQRYICSKCNYTWTESISFKEENHFITKQLNTMVYELLQQGTTMKEISILTGLNKNVIKAIDKKRLQDKYTVNGTGVELKKPERMSEYLGIDEFLLHKGHKYATLIMDLETGHVLYLAHGKKKDCVYNFINWVGMEWMTNVKAITCDMNSDFEEAFKEKCPNITIVYDHFHIVKNFNEKVISEVRKDEQKRLIEEGNIEAAKLLKGSKYVLIANKATRKQKDIDAQNNKVISKGSTLFNEPEIKQKSGWEEKYENLLMENKLFIAIDLVKEHINQAYKETTVEGMRKLITETISVCRGIKNKHFDWFAKLLENHYEGIVSHAAVNISTGKVEGTNNMIKTMRRQGYGYPDDDYFFLKIIDSSRRYSNVQ